MKPQLVDYSELTIGEKITKKIYTKTERISIFLNGILCIIIIIGFIFLYYRYKTREDNDIEVKKKIEELNNLIYS
tara:strand:+ start:235 stop:459 length:225 start_codon:yes stop_codon:yes gene_type:complete